MHVTAIARIEGYAGMAHGTLTVTPPGITYADESVDHLPIDGRLEIGSTIRYEAAPDDTSTTYFAGWGGGHCGADRWFGIEPAHDCTVGSAGVSRIFSVGASANFDKCPEPGTYVHNNSGARTCPGVHIVPDTPDRNALPHGYTRRSVRL